MLPEVDAGLRRVRLGVKVAVAHPAVDGFDNVARMI